MCVRACVYVVFARTLLQSKLNAHAPASELLDELLAVLEDDVGEFVAKLWRMLVFVFLEAKEEQSNAK